MRYRSWCRKTGRARRRGALCTADGQALSTGLGHSVPGPAPQGQQALAPLAAGFVSVPGEHDGETEFWLELSFDAAVAQGSKTGIRALLGVSGGSVTRLRRKDGRLDHWRVRVEPSSHEAVTVTLSPSPPCGATGAVCTEDGRTFTTALATQIQGPPGLTVADAQVQEAPERDARLRGHAQPCAFGHGDGGLRDLGRYGDGGLGLHGGVGDADLRRG